MTRSRPCQNGIRKKIVAKLLMDQWINGSMWDTLGLSSNPCSRFLSTTCFPSTINLPIHPTLPLPIVHRRPVKNGDRLPRHRPGAALGPAICCPSPPAKPCDSGPARRIPRTRPRRFTLGGSARTVKTAEVTQCPLGTNSRTKPKCHLGCPKHKTSHSRSQARNRQPAPPAPKFILRATASEERNHRMREL